MKDLAEQNGVSEETTPQAQVFRSFDEDPKTEVGRRVKNNYYKMHEHQTVAFVTAQKEKWCQFNHFEGTILEALDLLNDFVDEVDPDADFPNVFHAFQTAEGVRAKHPDKDWMHLTGLIHDLGKVMGKYGQPQWSIGGDTYPVGLAPRESIAYGVKSFKECPDMADEQYNTEFGMYTEHCGLDNLMMTWGHDEYLYQVLKNHPDCTLPEEGLWCIRYHSFYPWHDAGDYRDLCSPEDEEKLKWVNEFNKFDLYTKCDVMPDVEVLKPYYQTLIDKYIPGKVKF